MKMHDVLVSIELGETPAPTILENIDFALCSNDNLDGYTVASAYPPSPMVVTGRAGVKKSETRDMCRTNLTMRQSMAKPESKPGTTPPHPDKQNFWTFGEERACSCELVAFKLLVLAKHQGECVHKAAGMIYGPV